MSPETLLRMMRGQKLVCQGHHNKISLWYGVYPINFDPHSDCDIPHAGPEYRFVSIWTELSNTPLSTWIKDWLGADHNREIFLHRGRISLSDSNETVKQFRIMIIGAAQKLGLYIHED